MGTRPVKSWLLSKNVPIRTAFLRNLWDIKSSGLYYSNFECRHIRTGAGGTGQWIENSVTRGVGRS